MGSVFGHFSMLVIVKLKKRHFLKRTTAIVHNAFYSRETLSSLCSSVLKYLVFRSPVDATITKSVSDLEVKQWHFITLSHVFSFSPATV